MERTELTEQQGRRVFKEKQVPLALLVPQVLQAQLAQQETPPRLPLLIVVVQLQIFMTFQF
jgi:hypothetical protein